MSTTLKNNKKATKSNTSKSKATKSGQPITLPVIDGEQKIVNIAEIDFSPLNYRKYFSVQDLQDFAVELAVHGIISPLTLRPMPSGRYELVAGERRLRAAKIAGFSEVPVVVKNYTDEQVIEIQLAENMQRENPHPMLEAQGIGQMQLTRKTIDEIAARLGKSKAYVFGRIKLLNLIPSIQEMFLADVITILEASEIASLSTDSQAEFYAEYCANWQDQENFKLNNLRWMLSNFKYDLKNAPFDTNDEKLLPDASACTLCPSNTATLITLFPDLAKQAICSNKQCYQNKCTAHFKMALVAAFAIEQPHALLFRNQPAEWIINLLESIPDAAELPQHQLYEVQTYPMPQMPDKEDYQLAYEADDEDWDEESEGYEDNENQDADFDAIGFEAAVAEYQSDLEEYNQLLRDGQLLKGLYIAEGKVEIVAFSEKQIIKTSNTGTVTAKEVQEAMKAGTATPELLEAEIERIRTREHRAKELDREKVQLGVHDAFSTHIAEAGNNTLTNADITAARLLIYQSVGYSSRQTLNAAIIPPKEDNEITYSEHLYNVLSKLSEQQFSYLIRVAIASQSESKNPGYETGYFLYKTAEGAGVNVARIEEQQQQKVKDREDKQQIRIKELEMKIDRLKKTHK
jgi:ParB family chromosome partitioning protein